MRDIPLLGHRLKPHRNFVNEPHLFAAKIYSICAKRVKEQLVMDYVIFLLQYLFEVYLFSIESFNIYPEQYGAWFPHLKDFSAAGRGLAQAFMDTLDSPFYCFSRSTSQRMDNGMDTAMHSLKAYPFSTQKRRVTFNSNSPFYLRMWRKGRDLNSRYRFKPVYSLTPWAALDEADAEAAL